jgi:tRNA/tmRNA/rRNA uracil-C5-methylase (TrmA/RlmC/RlmD family)
MNASAVADAQLNADLNGIKNCRFICGKVCRCIRCYGLVSSVLLLRMLVDVL